MPIKTDDELYQGYLTKVYQHTKGMTNYSLEEKLQFAKEGVCVTYGELLYPSVKKLITYMNLNDADTFLDLGSGNGKCVLQVFMQTPVKKAFGIEANTRLHHQALAVAQNIKQALPFYWEENRDCQFIEANFLHLPWNEATVVYTCSTCFTQELLIAIGDKINITPSIQSVFSLRPLPSLQLPLKKVFQVECSWDTALCFMYQR